MEATMRNTVASPLIPAQLSSSSTSHWLNLARSHLQGNLENRVAGKDQEMNLLANRIAVGHIYFTL